MIKNITIGADPEFFVYDTQKEEIASAEGVIGGTKNDPRPLTDLGHNVQEDNIMVEFNIPPASDEESFKRDIKIAVEAIDAQLPSNLISLIMSSAYIDPIYLGTEQAKTFGCDPDYCVWTMQQNNPPNSESELRTCGGHIHVGYDNPNAKDSVSIIKALDLFLGVPSVLMDSDADRRKMYGQAGAFRGKEYGVEYRTLSNFWLANEKLVAWVYKATIDAINFVNRGNKIERDLSDKIIRCINNSETTLAKELIEEFNLAVVVEDVKELKNA